MMGLKARVAIVALNCLLIFGVLVYRGLSPLAGLLLFTSVMTLNVWYLRKTEKDLPPEEVLFPDASPRHKKWLRVFFAIALFAYVYFSIVRSRA